eukprot:TRINITY_DN3858_c0_g1_i2.p5 TRINITY_DN3858_c0_g1~~TRINITY_DN3858_c0_g1_i2.p5  ORF type:complete len:122 (-),score=1.73 TRINITY_DN3858_c0_g1_i2:100-465(-)
MLFFEIPSAEDMKTLGILEENFQCAGLCDVVLGKYMFSNVLKYLILQGILNSGKPEETCDTKVTEFIADTVGKFKKWAPIVLAFVVVAALDIICIFCTCCCCYNKETVQQDQFCKINVNLT